MTNFEKRWAWFFTLLGWQWQYVPKDHRYKRVRPDFRVVIPHHCEHCKLRSYTLDVFLRRGLRPTAFDPFWGLLQSLRYESKTSFDSRVQPALFGSAPDATLVDMAHGKFGLLGITGVLLPDNWKGLWKAARALTCHSVAQPVGELE